MRHAFNLSLYYTGAATEYYLQASPKSIYTVNIMRQRDRETMKYVLYTLRDLVNNNNL